MPVIFKALSLQLLRSKHIGDTQIGKSSHWQIDPIFCGTTRCNMSPSHGCFNILHVIKTLSCFKKPWACLLDGGKSWIQHSEKSARSPLLKAMETAALPRSMRGKGQKPYVISGGHSPRGHAFFCRCHSLQRSMIRRICAYFSRCGGL